MRDDSAAAIEPSERQLSPAEACSIKASRQREFSAGLRWTCGALAGVMGLSFAFLLFPADMLLGRWAWWGGITGDNATGLIGSVYIAQDQWNWPITHTRLLNPPEGVNIIYMDPVPIGALIGKVIFQFAHILTVHMGPWILLSYCLQSFIAWLIFRQLGLPPLAALAAAAVILLTPAFIWRVIHIGLVAHFVILTAVLFYLRSVSVADKREMYLSAATVGSIILVNPYLLAMSAAVFGAGIVEATTRNRIRSYDAAGMILSMAAVTGVMAVAFGIIGQGGKVPSAGGFGLYSMNLLSPITPQLSSLPGFESYILNHTGGQYEGFNYLGAGSLFLVAGALAFRFPEVRATILRNRILAAALLGLTIYAASSKLYLGSWFIADLNYEKLPVLKELTHVLRSSGRFFWPVGYIIVIAATAILAGRLKQRHALSVILIAVVLQATDIAPLLQRTTAASVPRSVIDMEAWTKAAEAYDGFTLYPSFHCAPQRQRNRILQLQLVAARAGIPSNGAYTSRAQLDCPGARARILEKLTAESVSPNSLIVILKETLPVLALEGKATEGLTCREGSFAFVCSRRSQANDPAFIALGREFKMPETPVGMKLSVRAGGEGVPFLGGGWSDATGRSRWADGPVTSIVARLDRPLCETLVFEAMVKPFSSGSYRVGTTKVVLNGQDSGRIELGDGGKQIVRSTIPLNGHCIKEATLELHFEGLRSPLELEGKHDIRQLSWQFDWFSVSGH